MACGFFSAVSIHSLKQKAEGQQCSVPGNGRPHGTAAEKAAATTRRSESSVKGKADDLSASGLKSISVQKCEHVQAVASLKAKLSSHCSRYT